MARPTKLNKTLRNKLVKLIKAGVSVEDACSFSGIAESTFYEWQQRGDRGDEGFVEFSEAINRARNAAKVTAINTLRNAMTPYSQTTTTTETYTETRFNKYTGKEFNYVEKTEKKSVTLFPGDWKAAIEYLKRRYSDEWGDRQKIEDWRDQALADLRDGKVTFEQLVEAFGGREALSDAFGSLAARLFATAGISVQVAAGADEA